MSPAFTGRNWEIGFLMTTEKLLLISKQSPTSTNFDLKSHIFADPSSYVDKSCAGRLKTGIVHFLGRLDSHMPKLPNELYSWMNACPWTCTTWYIHFSSPAHLFPTSVGKKANGQSEEGKKKLTMQFGNTDLYYEQPHESTNYLKCMYSEQE